MHLRGAKCPLKCIRVGNVLVCLLLRLSELHAHAFAQGV